MIVPEGVSEEDANIQYVDWRPSSTDVVYVYNNDIRMKRIGSDGKLGDEIRLTSSGVPGKLCKFSFNVLSKQIFPFLILIFYHELWDVIHIFFDRASL